MLTLFSQIVIGGADLCAAFLFMFGLKRMSSPATAPSGIRVAGLGMIAAVLASFLYLFTVDAAARPHMMVNIGLAVTALLIGGVGAWFVGRKVAMTAMPPAEATTTPATPSVTSIAAAFKYCWPATRHGALSTPSSLAQATSEPESETAPISAPSRVTPSCVGPWVLAPNSSTAAIAPAAPPPMPL